MIRRHPSVNFAVGLLGDRLEAQHVRRRHEGKGLEEPFLEYQRTSESSEEDSSNTHKAKKKRREECWDDLTIFSCTIQTSPIRTSSNLFPAEFRSRQGVRGLH